MMFGSDGEQSSAELFVTIVHLLGETDLCGLGPVTDPEMAAQIGRWVQNEGRGKALGVLPVRRFAELVADGRGGGWS
ncbi:MAG: hypothetical protein ACRDR6_10825 [Pseudonocardiaceae bacterium]